MPTASIAIVADPVGYTPVRAQYRLAEPFGDRLGMLKSSGADAGLRGAGGAIAMADLFSSRVIAA